LIHNKAKIAIESMRPEHWGEVRRIHLEGIETGKATFETDAALSWDDWSGQHLKFGRLVAVRGGVVGWAALTPVSDRCVYGGVAEVSIYIAAEARGQGVGSLLMRALIDEAERHGIWTLQAGIFADNRPSAALHEKCGFRIVGRRERLGKLQGVWKDVLLLERRSERVGID
jgi:phosphinothricin acetyltransferase